ncbi:hypothetical protein FQZ97_715290 [compost metagenome]
MTLSDAMPRIAAIAPTPTGTACCMACARKRTSGAACASVSTPDATSAEYSPSEWPATTDGVAPPSASQARHAATPATSITGCVLVVSASSSLGPFLISAPMSSLSASEASRKVSTTAG